MDNNINSNEEQVNTNNTGKTIKRIFIVIGIVVFLVCGFVFYTIVNMFSDDPTYNKWNRPKTTTTTTVAVAERNAFISYVKQVAKDTETQYIYDSNIGNALGSGYFIYDIKTDIGYKNTLKYEGYVVVDTTEKETKYIVFLHNDILSLVDFDKDDFIEEANITRYNDEIYDKYFKSVSTICKHVKKNTNYKCLHRNGYEITE